MSTQEESAERVALQELVRLKKLHDQCENMPSDADDPAEPEAQAMWQEYRRAKPIAWANAEAALSHSVPAAPVVPAEWQRIAAALVKLDAVYRQVLDDTFVLRPAWLRDALHDCETLAAGQPSDAPSADYVLVHQTQRSGEVPATAAAPSLSILPDPSS